MRECTHKSKACFHSMTHQHTYIAPRSRSKLQAVLPLACPYAQSILADNAFNGIVGSHHTSNCTKDGQGNGHPNLKS